MNTPATSRVLSPRETVARTNLSRATLYRMSKRSEFPAPLQLSARRIGWLEADVERWIAERVAQ